MCNTNASKYRLQYVGGFGTEFKSSDNYQEIVGVVSNDLLRYARGMYKDKVLKVKVDLGKGKLVIHTWWLGTKGDYDDISPLYVIRTIDGPFKHEDRQALAAYFRGIEYRLNQRFG